MARSADDSAHHRKPRTVRLPLLLAGRAHRTSMVTVIPAAIRALSGRRLVSIAMRTGTPGQLHPVEGGIDVGQQVVAGDFMTPAIRRMSTGSPTCNPGSRVSSK
jgi:hypothetical protein